jgi:hypothetical protein
MNIPTDERTQRIEVTIFLQMTFFVFQNLRESAKSADFEHKKCSHRRCGLFGMSYAGT